MKRDYVCVECGQEYEELGDGKCYACGGEIIPIDSIGKEDEPEEYPEDLMEMEDEEVPEEELDEEESL